MKFKKIFTATNFTIFSLSFIPGVIFLFLYFFPPHYLTNGFLLTAFESVGLTVSQMFVWPFIVIPESVYMSCGSGWISFCLPNPMILLPFFISALTIFAFVKIAMIISQKITPRRWAFAFSVIMLVSISALSFITYNYHKSELKRCIAEYQNKVDEIKHSPYVDRTGVIKIVFKSPKPSVIEATEIYKKYDVEYLTGNLETSAVYVKVPFGQEFEKSCLLTSYKGIYIATPPTKKDILAPFGTGVAFAKYLDKNFCNTGQIEKSACEQILMIYGNN